MPDLSSSSNAGTAPLIPHGVSPASRPRPSSWKPASSTSPTATWAHVVDRYKTIGRVAGVPRADLSSGVDSHNLLRFVRRPGAQQPVRTFNFSQWFTTTDNSQRATIRNTEYKLNSDAALTPNYQPFKYEYGRLSGQKDDETATDLYSDGAPVDVDADANMTEPMDELKTNYHHDASGSLFP